MHQFPALDHLFGWTLEKNQDTARIRPERATYADIGVGQRLSASVRWDVTLFARRERDALGDPDLQPRAIDGAIRDEGINDHGETGLSGSARGAELKIERRSQSEISGWVGYAYGVARYTDSTLGETFPADFDQRHTVSVVGTVPLPRGIRSGLTLRGGTNFPVPGYLVGRDGQVFVGGRRNQLRLPAYARLDVRGERTFHYARRRFTLFGEALNVLNRVNVGVGDGVIMRASGEALGGTERLFPRLLTAGVRFEF
jgi:hypothetical protein